MYISITGLELKSLVHVGAFYYYAVPSLRQAQNSKGNILAATKNINGVRHTLTAWDSEQSMRKFLYSGPHQKAIKAMPKFATGKTFGYVSDAIPTWDQVHRKWKSHGKKY